MKRVKRQGLVPHPAGTFVSAKREFEPCPFHDAPEFPPSSMAVALLDTTMISVNHSPSSTPCAYTSIPDADGQIAIRGEIMVTLSMCHAGWINLRLRYELMGCADAPVVFVLGGISAHRHIAATARFPEKGWVDGLVGAGRALDPGCFRLLSFDFLGADGQLDVPIDTADQADAIAVLLDRLGITTLYGFVGYSYGALVGLQFAIRHPGRVHRMIVVSGAHRAHPYAAAWRALQRRAVALGQLQCAEHQGLALARQFAMLSYRTPEEFGERFDAAAELINGRVRVAAEDYLDAAGAQYVACTPVNAYLRLSESIDLHRIDPTKVAVPTVVVAVEGDRLVPLSDLVALIEGLGTRGSLRVLRSPMATMPS